MYREKAKKARLHVKYILSLLPGVRVKSAHEVYSKNVTDFMTISNKFRPLVEIRNFARYNIETFIYKLKKVFGL